MNKSEEAIRNKLFSLQDIKYREFQCKLMPTVPPDSVIGIRTPVLRQLAKELHGTAEANEFIKILPHKYYEENNLHSFLIEKIKDYDELLIKLDSFLPYIDNWATCDSLKPVCFKKNTDRLYGEILRWTKSDKPFTVRFGTEMLMNYYLDSLFKPEYNEVAASVHSDEYYVNMMTAWYFATALAKQYDATLPYIENKRLDTWVHNKAIQKSVESYRITAEQKAYLKTLKIK